ncbi:MAG: L-lactate dehydrogenase [bacterium]
MTAMRPKVAVIGAGNVGSAFAFSLMLSGLAREIVLIDLDRDKAAGECMDLNHGLSFAQPARIYDAGYEGCAGSDLVVITAGASQKPGQTRIDLVEKNVGIFKEMIPQITRYAGDSVILVVTNPVDILTYVTLKVSGYASHRVLGSGTVLDTSRLRYLLSDHCNVDPRNVHAYIIGEHGDTELPVWSNASIGGMHFEAYCTHCVQQRQCDMERNREHIFEEVKNAAYKIIEDKGATYYAIALALVRITEALLRDENSVLPISTLITDYYDVNDVCLSIPSRVNKTGVERFLTLTLSEQEQDRFRHSAESLKQVLHRIGY